MPIVSDSSFVFARLTLSVYSRPPSSPRYIVRSGGTWAFAACDTPNTAAIAQLDTAVRRLAATVLIRMLAFTSVPYGLFAGRVLRLRLVSLCISILVPIVITQRSSQL